MPKKYYAVKVGKTPGIYETWAECQKQIHGFSGAVFKGFASREQALEFINRESVCQESDSDAKILRNLVHTEAVAYVDGSYDSTTNTFSYGMVFFHQGRELHFSEKYSDKGLAEMRNVAGELKGAHSRRSEERRVGKECSIVWSMGLKVLRFIMIMKGSQDGVMGIGRPKSQERLHMQSIIEKPRIRCK